MFIMHTRNPFHGDNSQLRIMMNDVDWSRCPLGSPEFWSPTLVCACNNMMLSSMPMMLMWGPDYVEFYNEVCSLLSRVAIIPI